MSKKHFDIVDRISAKLLDFVVRKSLEASPFQKRKIAALITRLIIPFKFSRKNYVKESLMESLGIDEAQALKLRQRVYENFIVNSLEMAKLKFISHEELLKMVEVEGYSNFVEAISKKKGAIILSGHLGLWEIIPQWVALKGNKVTTIVRRQNNKYVDQWFEEMRRSHGGKTTDSGMGMRGILRDLRQGYVLGLMMDQDNGTKGIFTKFMGKWASAPVGPSIISLKLGCPIVPLFVLPNYSGGKHLLKIYPPIYPEKYENTIEGQQKLSSAYTTLFESVIKEHPDQWFWLHRRWKTRPENCPDNPWVKLLNIDINKEKG